MRYSELFLVCCGFFLLVGIPVPSCAEGDGALFGKLKTIKAIKDARQDHVGQETGDFRGEARVINGREVIIHLPPSMPEFRQRSLVVVMHGGLGNGAQVQKAYKIDDMADRYGFIVVYLNGSRASPNLSSERHAWNGGGGCCGYPYKTNVDDVGYISSTVEILAREYGIGKGRVYGTGHSNGGIMAQRMMCETDVFAAIVPVSGPLMIDVQSCPLAKGKKILSIHGQNDENVPITGGKGTKGVTNISFKPQSYGQEVFRKSGATYILDAVPQADHRMDNIQSAILESEGLSFQEKIVHFFELDKVTTSSAPSGR